MHQLIKISQIIFALSIIFSFNACRVKKNTAVNDDSKQKNTLHIDHQNLAFDTNFQKLLSNKIEFEWFSMRCKTTYDDGNTRQQFSTNIRMKNDSIIWLSLSGPMGIEGLRLAITRDSFFLINKINKEYTARPITFLNEIVPLNTNLTMLQNLLLSMPVTIQESEKRYFEADSFAVFQQQNNALRQTTTVHQKNYTTREIMLADQRVKQDLKINFGNYRNIGEKLFPFQREINVNRGHHTMLINMEVLRYTINEPLTFPFEINENYKKN